jgi:pyruvate dehydrogenase E1 component beta subunit
MAADIAALIVEDAFDALKAPILKVTPPHTPVPYAPALEDIYLPDAARIAAAVRRVVKH